MEELVESILDYIRKDYTDYAIMINGEWGSGKTYFWNNKIKNKIEALELNGKRYKTIYMSLYGISNLEEISKKLFIETTQLMDKNLKRYMNNNRETHIPEYAKTGLNMANLFGVSQTGDRMDYSKFFATDDKVLCFDDLERANVDVIDVLGYINNYVEHDHIKTIIICNEKELATKLKNSNVEMKTFIATYILDKEGKISSESQEKLEKPMVDLIQDKIEYIFDKANDYERIKEKLIGETFEYIPEFSYIINGLLLRYENNTELIQFLRKNSSIITGTFNRTGTRNLRILKHALNDFAKIFENIQRHYPNTSEKHLKVILIFTIAISFEIKAGKVSKNKFDTIKSNEEYRTLLVASKILDSNKEFYIKEFDNNYFYNIKSDFKFFKFVEIYVRTRIFDMKIFREDMEKVIISASKEKLPAYKRLLTEEYWKIQDEEFNLIILETLQDVKLGKIELDEYVKLFVYFSYFVKRKLIDEDIKNLKVAFINGMNVASLKSTYSKNIMEEIEKIGIEIESEEMKEVLDHFNNINEQLKDRLYIENAEEIFKLVPNNMEIFYDKFQKNFQDIPIFKYYDTYRLFELLLNLTNEQLVNFKDLIVSRHANVNLELEPEVKSIKLLKQIIDDYIRGKIITIKIVILKDMSKEMEVILDKYKNLDFEE